MLTLEQSVVATYGSNINIEKFLMQYDSYILIQAEKIVWRNSSGLRYPSVLDLLIDDVAQGTRIKLWQMLIKGQAVRNPRALIKHIVHSVFIDLVRQSRPDLPLSVDNDGELLQGKLMVPQSEELDNPEYVYGQKEAAAALLDETARRVSPLSPRQKHSMVYLLQESTDDPLQLEKALLKYGVNIKEFPTPETKEELKGLKANVSAARKKLCSEELVLV